MLKPLQERYCLDCGSPIRGRADKKFCGDACRSSHYYHQHLDASAEIRRINIYLRKNYRILDEMAASKTDVTIPFSQLRELGFIPHYLTSVEVAADGAVWNLCYNYAWLVTDQGAVKIRRIQLPFS